MTVRLVLGGVSVVETETGAGVSAVIIPCLQGERMVLVPQYCSHVWYCVQLCGCDSMVTMRVYPSCAPWSVSVKQ